MQIRGINTLLYTSFDQLANLEAFDQMDCRQIATCAPQAPSESGDLPAFDFTPYEHPQRMPAAQQRKVFGYAIFGKKEFAYWRRRNVWVVKIKVAFGRDWSESWYTHAELLDHVANKKKLEVG